MRKWLCVFFLGIIWQACQTRPVVSLPPEPSRRDSQAVESTLNIPYGLTIRSVQYDVELYSSSDNGTTYEDGRRGRSFINVYAVHRNTGEQYLLIYENDPDAPDPIQIIKFEEKL